MRKLLFTITALFFLFAFAEAQKSWRVNNIPGIDADFTSLSAAIDAAAAGDTIYMESSPNNYAGATFDKRLYIFGTGYFLTDSINPKTQWNRNDAYVSGTISLNPGATGSVISGLHVSTIRISDSAITIERCYTNTIYLASNANSIANNSVIRQNYIINIYSQTSTGTAKDILIHNNIITQSIAFSGNVDNSTAYFINNNFTGNGYGYTLLNSVFQNNIFRYPNFGTYLGSNAFYNNISANNNLPQSNGNIASVNLNDVYVDYNGSAGASTDGKWVLKPGSVASNAGDINGTTVDIGAFGGPAPYILSGMPPIPSIYKLSVPIQINAGVPTMTISISAAAH